MQNKLKVGFDISQIAHTGGVGVYTQNLAKNLLNDEDLEMVFFYSSLRKPYKGSLKNVKAFRLPPTMFEVLFNRVRTTKKDLLEVSQIPEEKIKVIYEGVEERFKIQKKEDIEEFKKKYNLPNNFLMAIGGIGERKNLKRIKEASKDYNLIVL